MFQEAAAAASQSMVTLEIMTSPSGDTEPEPMPIVEDQRGSRIDGGAVSLSAVETSVSRTPVSSSLTQRWQKEEQERWRRHIRKMESLDEQQDYASILRYWDYSHKKFRNCRAGGQSSVATSTTRRRNRDEALASSEASMDTHEQLQMAGSVARQSVIMISKRKSGGAAEGGDPLLSPPLLPPKKTNLDNEAGTEVSGGSLPPEVFKEEDKEDEEEAGLSLEEKEGQNLENLDKLEQILQVNTVAPTCVVGVIT